MNRHSFKDHFCLRSFGLPQFFGRKRVQRYCFFLNWPNIFAFFLHYFFTFFISHWKSTMMKNAFFRVLSVFLWKRGQNRSEAPLLTHARVIIIKERAYARVIVTVALSAAEPSDYATRGSSFLPGHRTRVVVLFSSPSRGQWWFRG